MQLGICKIKAVQLYMKRTQISTIELEMLRVMVKYIYRGSFGVLSNLIDRLDEVDTVVSFNSVLSERKLRQLIKLVFSDGQVELLINLFKASLQFLVLFSFVSNGLVQILLGKFPQVRVNSPLFLRFDALNFNDLEELKTSLYISNSIVEICVLFIYS